MLCLQATGLFLLNIILLVNEESILKYSDRDEILEGKQMLNDTKRENSWLPFLCITLSPCQLLKKCRPLSACLSTRAEVPFISKPRIASLFFHDVHNPSSLFGCCAQLASKKINK